VFREVEALTSVTAPAAIAEGGEVTVIQSGWRLGLRAFAQKKKKRRKRIKYKKVE